MPCNCNISVTYTQTLGQNSFYVGPITLFSETEYNDKPLYYWTDAMSGIKYSMYWALEFWVIEIVEGGYGIVAILNEDTDCPVGNTGTSNWEIQEVASPPEYLITELQTIGACDNTTECTSWESITNIEIPEPWFSLVFLLDSLPSFVQPGTNITSFSSINPLVLSIVGVTVGSLIYLDDYDSSIVYNTPGPNRTFLGIILVGPTGSLISPTSYGIYESNSGGICFDNPTSTTAEINQECFDKLVWEKQCEFAQCVLNYLRQLQFGSAPCDMLENLKDQRRALEILNCYDTRDIEFNTTDYNTLTYSQIKKLLNS